MWQREKANTHLVKEEDLPGRGVGPDGASEVHVHPLLDAGGVQASPDGQGHNRGVWWVEYKMNRKQDDS